MRGILVERGARNDGGEFGGACGRQMWCYPSIEWPSAGDSFGLLSELLARCPEIAEVERLVAAANAWIGVAKTAALPHIALPGQPDVESTNMTILFGWQNGIGFAGGIYCALVHWRQKQRYRLL